MTAVDLDLDVVRFCDGRLEVVDRDEFELHRRRYGYPDDLVVAAEQATSAAYDQAAANAPPFDGVAAAGWVERAQGR